MVNWSRSERTPATLVEYTVPAEEPWGAEWNQLWNALQKAVEEWEETHNGDIPSDDAIRVHVYDDKLVITFEKYDEQAQ